MYIFQKDMQSLVDLSVSAILKNLDLDCQEILLNHLLKDRVYDLSTYVASQEHMLVDGYFLVFVDDYTDSRCLGLTCHVASLCFGWASLNHPIFHAYYIPRSLFNDIIILDNETTQQSKVQVTCRRCKRDDQNKTYTSIETIEKDTETNIKEWQEWESPQVPVKYYIPK